MTEKLSKRFSQAPVVKIEPPTETEAAEPTAETDGPVSKEVKDVEKPNAGYVDPMVAQLKQTDVFLIYRSRIWIAYLNKFLFFQNVREMYLLAEEIIHGLPNERFFNTNKLEDSDE